MEYRLHFVKNISKFGILGFNNLHQLKTPNSIWGYFWSRLFSEKYLQDFFDTKFNDFQKKHLTSKQYFYYEIERDFILKNISRVIEEIDFVSGDKKPKAEDVFGMYRIFTTVLGFYNNYYGDSHINISLHQSISYTKPYSSIKDLLRIAEYYEKTSFFQEVVIPIFEKLYSNISDTTLFYNRIFWPEEIIHLIIFSKYIKKSSNAKLILNLSKGNEQYDFSQWKSFLLKNSSIFSYIDFFIIDNDYDRSVDKILQYLNNNQQGELNNVIYLKDGKICYNEFQNDGELGFQESNKAIFNRGLIYTLNGKKAITSRLTPYECYWNQCNFCAINSQNKLQIDDKFDHKYYINRWIDFIKQNNISHVSFIDEAIPPLVLLNLAKSILDNDLQITYFLRTRIEKFYTLKNLKIIHKSGARFFGMGLESASDTTNEMIGNKGNGGSTVKEKAKLVNTMDQLGISVHNYAILGFPGEQEKDYLKTYVFLKNNIIKSRQYTCSPNIFRLMKGPEIFTNRHKYGIKIIEDEELSDFHLSYEFSVNGKKRNYKLLFTLVNDLHRLQFTPWLSKDVECIAYEDFWAFIDRSEIFYLMKNLYTDSPYYTYKNINDGIENREYRDFKKYYFEVSEYICDITDEFGYKLYDWISCKTVTLENQFKDFIESYNSKISLEENIGLFSGNKDIIIRDIYLLFDAKILKCIQK